MVNKIAIQAALTRQLFSASYLAQVASIFLAAFFAYTQSDVIDSEVVLAWVVLVVLVALLRITLAIAFNWSDISDNSAAHFWLTGFRLGIFASGIAWGSATILLFPANDPQYQTALLFILAGLTAGGLASYSADLISGTVFIVLVISPLIVRLYLSEDNLSVLLSIGLMLYLGFMIMNMRYLNRNVSENIALRLEAAESEKIAKISEQRHRLLLNHSPVGILHYDNDLIITYCNECFAAILNTSAERLTGVDMNTLKDKSVHPALRKALEGELGYYEGYYHATYSDANRWAAVTCAPSLDSEGKIVGGVAIVQNITERKETERKFKESLAFSEGIINAIPDVLFEMDRDGRFRNVWTKIPELLAVHKKALLGKTVNDALAPDSAATVMEILREADMWELSCGKVIRLTLPEGEKWLELSVSRKPGSSSSAATFLMLSRDITERKQAEAYILKLNAELDQRVHERTIQLEAMNLELRESEQRYREIFNHSVEGVCLLEVTAEERFRIIDINPALESSTGMSRAAMIGKFVDEALPEEASAALARKLRRSLETGKTIAKEIVLDLPVGKRNYFSTVTPIYYKGRIRRLLGISRDITELKNAERELKESREQLRGLTAQRERAREEERKHIAREVHDELGQILTGLKLNISVLNHKLDAGQGLATGKLQETMLLTDRALEVARNVASALRPSALEMGIASALEWLVDRFGTNTGILCELHIDDDDIQLDEAHAIALFRIVQESLTNVSRHAKAERVDIIMRREAGSYVLKVKDNGVGFDARLKKTDSFGLVGIRERALMLGGTVDIDSQPGKGTEIVVRIPVQTTVEES